MRITRLCFLVSVAIGLRPASAADWPQWLGPNRASVWQETGVLDRFPDDGLQIIWRAPVELGYSGPAVSEGKVFLTDYVRRAGEITNNPGGRDKLEGTERVLCFAADTGRLLWKFAYERPYNISYPRGPRCTPTVAAGKVYTLGAEGDLLCLDAGDGRLIWRKELTKKYQVETPIWGFAAHPLVDGDLLFCVVGGAGSVAVAFDNQTGREVWRALSASEPGYCPPTLIQHAGTKQLLIWHPDGLNSLNPRTGEVFWTVPLKPGYGMSITAPRQAGEYLYASGIGSIAVMLKLNDGQPGAEDVWRGAPKTAVYCAGSTPFLADGMIYGCDCQLGALMGARLADGERLWQTFQPTTGGDRRASHGTACLVRHDDRYLLLSETGDLILAKLSPAGYEELSRFHLLEPTNEAFGRPVVWSHPAFAQRCVFARNDKELVCASLAADP
jgi:outer membrane protein assembly factor BamB